MKILEKERKREEALTRKVEGGERELERRK
jgi:hypothetical protein